MFQKKKKMLTDHDVLRIIFKWANILEPEKKSKNKNKSNF